MSYQGFRVAVVGSCQVVGLRQWTERFLPGAMVQAWHVGSSPAASPELVAPQLDGADLVITQMPPDGESPLDPGALKARHANVVYLPMLVFPGFHPDITFAVSATQPLRGPLDTLQSEIVLAAFHLGLPPENVSRLFNALVFHALGYFDAFSGARAALVKIFAEQGFDLDAAIDEWLRDGAFMYSDNHPRLRVLRTLARMALTKAGLAPAEPPAADDPPDTLANSIHWPIYPAFCRRLGVPGSSDFIRSIHVARGAERVVGLRAFVEETYRVLREVPAGQLQLEPRTLQTIETLRRLIETRGASAA